MCETCVLCLVVRVQPKEMSSGSLRSEERFGITLHIWGLVYEKDAFNVKMTFKK